MYAWTNEDGFGTEWPNKLVDGPPCMSFHQCNRDITGRIKF